MHGGQCGGVGSAGKGVTEQANQAKARVAVSMAARLLSLVLALPEQANQDNTLDREVHASKACCVCLF